MSFKPFLPLPSLKHKAYSTVHPVAQHKSLGVILNSSVLATPPIQPIWESGELDLQNRAELSAFHIGSTVAPSIRKPAPSSCLNIFRICSFPVCSPGVAAPLRNARRILLQPSVRPALSPSRALPRGSRRVYGKFSAPHLSLSSPSAYLTISSQATSPFTDGRPITRGIGLSFQQMRSIRPFIPAAVLVTQAVFHLNVTFATYLLVPPAPYFPLLWHLTSLARC